MKKNCRGLSEATILKGAVDEDERDRGLVGLVLGQEIPIVLSFADFSITAIRLFSFKAWISPNLLEEVPQTLS